MIVISGCPRSGTSMMMRIMANVFGEDRILRRPDEQVKEASSDDLTEVEKYLVEKMTKDEREKSRKERTRSMNPNGYYEMAFCIKGLRYLSQYEQLLKRDELGDDPKMIVKVVSQGLAASDPRHVDKVIFMARNPRSVAKSQENLTRHDLMNPEDAPVLNDSRVLVRSVSMYNRVTPMAAEWIRNHPEIPVHVVEYDRLLDSPEKVLAEIQEFLGEGDWSNASELIDNKLRRSEPCENTGEDWALADKFHELVVQSKWNDVVTECVEYAKREREITRWFCVREMNVKTKQQCELCRSDKNTRNNFRRNAERRGHHWLTEPCVFECQFDKNAKKHLSIEESIRNNFWINDHEKTLFDVEAQQEVLKRMIARGSKRCEIEKQKEWILTLEKKENGDA